MQVRKVAVVATGALATAAAMGSTPAFATDSSAGTPEIAPAIAGVLDYQGKHRPSDEAMREVAEQWLTSTPGGMVWSAPWDQNPPQILSLGSRSALSLAPLQHCGSSGPGVAGITAPVASPATVLGGCRNGNIDLAGGDGDDALFSILDDTAISALSWQMCGSNGVGGLGINVPVASPATVTGNCDNGNITVEESDDDPMYLHRTNNEPKTHAQVVAPAQEDAPEQAQEQVRLDDSAPWDRDPPQILSVASGSAASLASRQHCGSSGPSVLGGTAPIASPSTVLGNCRNGNIDIHGDGTDGLFSFLDNSALSVASGQMCGSNAVGGLGVNVPMASPATAVGCGNGNISID